MRKKKDISVFNYTDYRQYLNDFFNNQKNKDPKFSYRRFAQKAGYNSSGLLKEVIKGRLNILNPVIMKFVRGIGLGKREAAFFENLVYFNQAGTNFERNAFFGRMMHFLSAEAYRVHKSQLEYYSKWYYAAIRELLSVIDFKDDYKTLGRLLIPHITQAQAQLAIKKLIKFGFIKKNKDGFYKSVSPSITNGPEVSALHIHNFQRAMIDLGKDALDNIPKTERNVSTLTFSANHKSLEEIRQAADAFRTRVKGIIESHQGEDRVCQLNIQLFPLSRPAIQPGSETA